MTAINIQFITSKALREKKFSRIFPEFYNQANVIENNLWHNNQSVFDHVIGVYEGLETLLQFKELDPPQKTFLTKYLSDLLKNSSRRDILKVATLLHDIAKTDTLIISADGTTRCSGHELIAAERVKRFSVRFNLDKQDEQYVQRIVRYHGLISDFLNLIIVNGNKEKYLRIFKETVGDVAIELVLLMHADLLGSDLKKRDKKAYDDRIRILSWMLIELQNYKS